MFTNDKLELLNEADVQKSFEISDFDGDYKEFIERCIADGSIREIPVEEAREVTVENIYYDLFWSQYDSISYTDYIFVIKETVSNGKEINWAGVSHIVIDDEDSKITSASGYSPERGEFTDLY